MSGQIESRGSLQNTRPSTTNPHTRPDVRQTQRQRVLTMLLEADEVCGSEMYAAFLPRFSVQIYQLRKAGYVITKRPCDRVDHEHAGTAWLYRLEAVPGERDGR